ncbi:hypothetical protein CO670_26835 [Rhizobium sp. J15]|nr:hypothetical protein CO670_26835 [Rhizobium sp. J15]
MADGTWRQPRSADLIDYSPSELVGRPIVLSRDVNVRDRIFELKDQDVNGCTIVESEIIGFLQAGQEVILTEVTPFSFCDTYIWARVRQRD